MSQRSAPGQQSRVAFRIVAVAALVAAIGQVVLGGVVRVTDSGLGCPDWPLCYGRIVPPLELASLIEYSHRLSATLLGVLVLAVAVMAWRYYRADLRVTVPSTLALALVLVAALIGGAAVRTELAWWVVLLHLGLAESVVACMVVVSVAGWESGGLQVAGGPERDDDRRYKLLLLGTLGGSFALILSGSYMVGLGYGSACTTWPLCNGSLLPEGSAFGVHMAHRYAAALVGVLIVWTTVWTWSRGTRRPGMPWASLLAVGVFATQALVGAATVWTGFSAPLKALHLGTGTLLWMSLVLMGALNLAPRRFEFGAVGQSPGRATGLERAAP